MQPEKTYVICFKDLYLILTNDAQLDSVFERFS